MERVFAGNTSVLVSGDQLSTEIGDEVVILGLKDSVYYGLSRVGTRIWQLLQTRRTVDEIVDALVAEYDVTRQDAADDLQRLLIDLQARGLVAISPPDRP